MSSKPALTFLLLWWQRWDMDLPLLALMTQKNPRRMEQTSVIIDGEGTLGDVENWVHVNMKTPEFFKTFG